MSGVVAIALTNAASATLLALVAAAASRVVRRPALVHGLWLLVLLELLTPPVLVVDVLPAIDRPAPAARIPVTVPPQAVTLAVAEPDASAPTLPAPTWRQLAVAAWLLGTAALLLLALVRGIRFERLLGRGAAAPAPLLTRAQTLARALGLRRAPAVRLVPARISPLLWFRPGRMEIVFPAALVERLAPAELDALLAHELAHVRRGDHWVRWLELAASALFFWHPVVWWARARMHSAEERSCDAWVTAVLPAHAREYAGGVVKALEFLSPARGPVLPALASGVARFRSMEERLTMILSHRTPPRATRTQRIALAAAGIGLLLLFPAAANRAPDESDPESERPAEESSAPAASPQEVRSIQAELERLEHRRLELAQRLHELQARGVQNRQVESKAALLEQRAQNRLEREQVQARLELERALAERQGEEERSFAVEQKALALESLMRKAQIEAGAQQAERLEEELAAMRLDLELAERGRRAVGESQLRRAQGELDQSLHGHDARARVEAELERLLELYGLHDAVSDGVRGGVDDGVREAIVELERALEEARRARPRGTVY